MSRVLTLALVLAAVPGAALAAGFSQTGGGLGSINVNITVRPTASPSGGSSGSSGSNYRERDWSPGERASSQSSADIDLFAPIAAALKAFADDVARATKPLRDYLDEIEKKRKRNELARQMRAQSIQRIRTLAEAARADDQATLEDGLVAMFQWGEEIKEVDHGNCTAQEHGDLQDKVNRACKQLDPAGGRLATACKKLPFGLLRTPEQCAELQSNLAQNLGCAAARLKINVQCYDGGDEDHQDARRDALRAAAKCRAIIDAECSMFGIPAGKP